jgi:hypothetical protein
LQGVEPDENCLKDKAELPYKVHSAFLLRGKEDLIGKNNYFFSMNFLLYLIEPPVCSELID